MQFNEFLEKLQNFHAPNSRQEENLDAIIKISDKFHRDARIPKVNSKAENSIVLESGHQPNYLPYPGTWKKAFLLDLFRRKLENSVALFGFADYNLCTASILYSNKIPAITKTGSEKIGFRISKNEKWKSFNSIKKPTREEFENEMEHVKNHYKNYLSMAKLSIPIEQNLEEIEEIMWKSYDLSDNLADLNAFIFSKICREIWNLEVNFFRYSDVQKDNIFIDECEKLIKNIDQYNTLYNEILIKEKLTKISPVKEDSFPFWYHCNCDGKISLTVKSRNPLICTGVCLSCKKFHELNFQDMREHYSRMSITGVARNLIFSEGLGTTLYISGSGGGLNYGKISTRISKDLGFHLPITLAWRSRDYYLGVGHLAGLYNFARNFRFTIDDITERDITQKIREMHGRLLECVSSNKREDQKLRGQLVNIKTQLNIINSIFKLTPSILELFTTIGISNVKKFWGESLTNAEIKLLDEFYLISRDITYNGRIERDRIPAIYEKLTRISIE